MRPLLVVEGDERALRQVTARLRRDGWLIRDDLGERDGPPEAGPQVRCGTVLDQASARQALLAALAGDGLVVRAVAEPAVVDRLVEDLRHLGPVAVLDGRAPVTEIGVLPPDQQRLVALLLDGHSLVEAAAILSVSVRTADRRMAAVRRFLGARSTAQALHLARGLVD